MSKDDTIELFVLKCAVITRDLRKIIHEYDDFPSISYESGDSFSNDGLLKPYLNQFDLENRSNAFKMSSYYRIFYLLENDIRRLISETLVVAHGSDWWDKCAPPSVKDEVDKNIKRESEAGISLRSNDPLDYTTFGQLGEIIRSNWSDFAGIMRNQAALSRVLHSLNMSRATIAHCGLLGADEIDRLTLSVRDWFRVLAGPTT